MKKRTLVIALTALVVALVAVSGAWAATRPHATGSASRSATPGAAAGWCRGLASSPTAWKEMQTLRAQHLADMKAWQQEYGADPTSAAAQAALAKLRAEHINDMLALMKKYGIKAGTSGRSTMMGGSSAGYGGMMGGSGSGYGMMGGL